MSAIHPTAQAGWGGRGAADYEAGRPGYPSAAVALIASELAVGAGDLVLDLAAGTGKFTRALVAGLPGVEVVAVEPVAEMRAQLAAAVPDARVLAGTAEDIPVDDGSVRVVCVAQAFHWFDVPRAAAEIARVLRADGGLVIVRNDWRTADAGGAWAAAIARYLDAIAKPETHGRDWRGELDATGLFGPFTERTVDNAHAVDRDGLLTRCASMSFIAALPDARRAEVLGDLERLLDESGITPGQPITMPDETYVRWARRR